jgi:hypothetical protein
VDTVVEKWIELREQLTPREKLDFDLRVMALGVQASPRTVEQDTQAVFKLIISGLDRKPLENTLLVDQEQTLVLPEAGPDMEEV